jgi:hypothetical protein
MTSKQSHRWRQATLDHRVDDGQFQRQHPGTRAVGDVLAPSLDIGQRDRNEPRCLLRNVECGLRLEELFVRSAECLMADLLDLFDGPHQIGKGLYGATEEFVGH